MTGFTEVADRVFVLRYPELDVNSVLVAGDGAALLADTLATAAQAAELRNAVARITTAPLTVLNTHHHFDHSFGNATVAGQTAPIWAHPRCAELLREHSGRIAHLAAREFPQLAPGLADTPLRAPDHEVHESTRLDVGGRAVELRYFGRGHTDNDVVAFVPDAGVTIAGDLIEVGAPPSFGDSWPLEWALTLGTALDAAEQAGAAQVFVPGHGDPVGIGFVRTQHAELAELEWLCRDGHADTAPQLEVAARSPFGAEASLTAVRRAYADLDGRL
jgi:glyoxylase-like metal-dependent hydrolase (beta-lactamase superfamily II)